MPHPLVEVLYEEGPCLVLCKPTGLLTQAPPGIDSLEARLRTFLAQREEKTGKVYLGVPHRLDRPVSGAIVFARHQRAARRLAEQFESRTVEKVYWACVLGEPSPGAGRWSDFMKKTPDEPRAELAPETDRDARSAVLHYQILGRAETVHGLASWLEIRLESGRYHQIRLQCSTHGHPILGDEQYTGPAPFGPVEPDPRSRPIALHARRLSFHHPMTQSLISVEAPLPAPWLSLGFAFPPVAVV